MKNDPPQVIRPSALRKKRINIPRSVAAPCSASSSTWTTDRHAAKDEGYQHLIRESAEPHNPAQKKFELSNRKLVEFCCGHDSLLGNDKYKARGCAIVRLTIDDDLTTVKGLRKALDEVRNSKPGQYVHLWGSLPCTGGSPWQRVNARHPNAKVNLGNHIATFNKLISGFKIVAEEVIGKGGDVSYEWPTGCTLWGTKVIQDMLMDLGMNKVNMHGCSAGLTSKEGTPIKKPWTIATTSPILVKMLSTFQCPGKEVHPEHAPCAGAETKRTERYTEEMTDRIHDAIAEEALSHRASTSSSAMPTLVNEYDEDVNELINLPEPSGHREKIGPEPLRCTMITKTPSTWRSSREQPRCAQGGHGGALRAEGRARLGRREPQGGIRRCQGRA